jgi:5-dehydro-2-deoxygluconokinase
VAVAAARYGHSSVVITGVGDDALGEYVCTRLGQWGVTTDYIERVSGVRTPVVLAALDPPEDPTIVFYRGEAAPDTRIARTVERDAIVRDARVFWMSQGALAQGETARSSLTWLQQRARAQFTILDLDYRPTMWSDIETARAAAQQAIACSSVVVGNRDECTMALGVSEPDAAADALLTAGVSLAIVKMGGGGVLLATDTERVRIAPVPISVLCGLGAGDAFGGALAHALLAGWDLREIGEFANAAGAYVATKLTCADAMPTADQVEALRTQGRIV